MHLKKEGVWYGCKLICYNFIRKLIIKSYFKSMKVKKRHCII